MKQIILREAQLKDCNELYQLHIDSIQHYCSGFYSVEAISAWVQSKSPDVYKNDPPNQILLVVEYDKTIVGFAWLNILKKKLEGLYLAPKVSSKGYGKLLLDRIENIAKTYQINELQLSSTLNAVEFYHHMGYSGDIVSTEKLKSGMELNCVKMKKKL